MTYDEAMEYLSLSYKFGSKLGLARISTLLKYMGNPHKELKFIHLAGTNGKGSTTAFISNILMDASLKVGIFTSPYIHRFGERIKVGNNEITKQDIARIMEIIKDCVEQMKQNDEGIPTEFEVVTAMAMQYYYENACEIVVLEVGLGGRLDSTNVIDKPEVAVITTIDYDHMDMLGSTLAEIAKEKAGIIKEGGDVVLYPVRGEVLQTIEDKCTQTNSRLYKVNKEDITIKNCGLEGICFDYKNYKDLQITLISDFQAINASMAIAVVEQLIKKGYKISGDNIKTGLLKAKWPGRFEIINISPAFIADGAHNIEGVQALERNLRKYFDGRDITFIIGIMADKDYRAIIETVAPIANRFITVTPKNPRAMDAKELAGHLQKYQKEIIVAGEVKAGVETALRLCGCDGVICSFGSLYYISEVREYFGLN